MARMYSRKKGKSGSKKPVKKVKPSWLSYDAKTIQQLIIKLAKTEKTPSQIGLVLRDTYGIPDVKTITKKKISQILEENQLKSKLPEDIVFLIKKVIKIVKHLETNKKDEPAKRGLIITESKIKKLSDYYKRTGILPESWKYERDKAKLLIG